MTALGSILVFLCLDSETWLQPQDRLISKGLTENTFCTCAVDNMADLQETTK